MEKTIQQVATRPNQSCAGCKFSGSTVAGNGQLNTICRKRAPSSMAQAIQTGATNFTWISGTFWPSVSDADWCGEFEAAGQVS